MTDIHPTLERILVTDIEGALRRLTTDYVLPDGTEAIDGRAVRSYRRQIENGYFLRLVWPFGVTHEQVLAWFKRAEEIVSWYKFGVL